MSRYNEVGAMVTLPSPPPGTCHSDEVVSGITLYQLILTKGGGELEHDNI